LPLLRNPFFSLSQIRDNSKFCKQNGPVNFKIMRFNSMSNRGGHVSLCDTCLACLFSIQPILYQVGMDAVVHETSLSLLTRNYQLIMGCHLLSQASYLFCLFRTMNILYNTHYNQEVAKTCMNDVWLIWVGTTVVWQYKE
jgi:hypothetical protein